jgi:zinc protease
MKFTIKIISNLFLIGLMLLSSTTMASTLNTETFKLNNGLSVILLNDPTASIVTVKTMVKIGSVYEENYYGSGISHYLEHIVAGGSTSKNTEKHYTNSISLMGGVSNAYTTTDHTSYFINTTKENLNLAITTIYEWMFFNSFETKEVNREKEVIIREIEKNNANINRKFYYLSQENLYKSHPVKFPVIGYIDTFKKIKKTDLKDFYKKYYIPSNIILVVGGNLNNKNTKTYIETLFNNIEKKPSPIIYESIQTPPIIARKATHILDMNKSIVNLRFPTVKLNSKYLYPLDLLDYMLGNGTQSILYKKLVDEKKLAYSVYTSSYTPQYCEGYFEIQIEVDSKNIDIVISQTLQIINSLKTEKLDNSLINRAKKQKLAENILSIDSIEDKTSRLALSYFYSETLDFYDKYAQNFKDINAENIQKSAIKFFNTQKLITTIGLEKNKNELLKTQKKTYKEESNIKKITLKNGIRVLLYPDDSLPSSRAQILTLGGILLETNETNGIGTLYTNLIGNKTSKLSKPQIQSTFENNGANTSAAIGNHSLYYTLNSLSDDFNELFNLFLTTFFDIKFNSAEIDDEKRKISNRIKQREDDWYSINNYLFKKEFWKNHPYSLSKLGELNSIKTITKKDLEIYHQKLLNPKNIIISIQGNFDENKIIKTIENHTKALSKKNILQTNQLEHPEPSIKKISEIKKSHKFNTSSLFIGYLGTPLTNIKDKVELDLIDAVLTGMSYPGGRLHNKLRGKGYVYLVHGVNFTGLKTGYIYIYALSNKDSINKVKTIVLDEIETLKKTPISKNEYEESIARMKMYYKQRLSSIDNQLLINATDEIYTNNYLFSKKYEQEINLLNKNSTIDITKKYFNNPKIMIFNPK